MGSGPEFLESYVTGQGHVDWRTTPAGGLFTSGICKTETIFSIFCLVYVQGECCPWFRPVPCFEKALGKIMKVMGTKLPREIRLKHGNKILNN